MRIWIDADAAPREVKEVVFKAALRLQLDTVQVGGGPDVADRHIADHAQPGDVAVTADIPLAARLVEKQVAVIDPRGDEYTEENVGERLAFRDLMDGLRDFGLETGGPRPYTPKDRQAFAAALDRVLTRALRAR